MGTVADKLGYYSQVGATVGAGIKTGPSGFFGVISTATGGTVTIYDGTNTSGTVIFNKTLAAGDLATLPIGVAAKSGLFIVNTAGNCIVLYT